MALENVQDIYPLSATQAGMIFHSIVEPQSGVYIGQVCCELVGALDRERLESTWATLLERHDVLRTVFVWEEIDEPLQIVRERVEPVWTYMDWSNQPEDIQAETLERWKTADRTREFDLTQAPLMRLTLVRLHDERHDLVWTTHHALADGWSLNVLLREMQKIYRDLGNGLEGKLPVPFPYSRYIAWLNARDLGAAQDYWRARLKGFRLPLTLKTAAPTLDSVVQAKHAETEIELGPDLSERLVQFARETQVSLYTVFQAAWGLLLNRYSDESDIVFGVTTSGRPADLQGIDSAVGLFINTLPVRHDFSSDKTVQNWLKQIQLEAIAFAAHEHTPLSKVNEWSDIAPGTALFDTILVFSSYPRETEQGGAAGQVSIESCETFAYSNYGIALLIEPDSSIEMKLVFDIRKFSAATAERILRDVVTLLAEIARNPDGLTGDILLPAAAERERMLALCAGETLVPAFGDTLLDQFSRQADRLPDSPAVTYDNRSITYRELAVASSAGAWRLIAAGIRPGQYVGISLEPGIDLIVAILSVLKAGAAYIPIDPEYPRERTRHILQDASIPLVLTGRRQEDLLESAGVKTLCLSDSGSSELETGELPPVTEDAPAYVIYTSGSTGQPKGVRVTHGNLAYSTNARQQYYRQRPAAFLLLSSFAFDSSVAGIFWTLTTGGNLVLTARRSEQDVGQLTQVIERHQVTHTLCLPSLYQTLLEGAEVERLQTLNTVVAAGEVLLPDLVRRHRQLMPQSGLFNEYGPTEGTVWCTVFDTSRSDGESAIPIGRPIPGARIYLLDSRGRMVPPGVAGELHIAGPGVAGGYLGNPGMEAEKFLPDPFPTGSRDIVYRTGDLGRQLPNGDILFLGRIDDQLKLRGHRIEISEIEATLQTHPDVESAVILLDPVDQREPTSGDQPLSDDAITLLVIALGEGVADALLNEIEPLSEEEVAVLLGDDLQSQLNSLEQGETR